MLIGDPWPRSSLLGKMRRRDREALLSLGTEVTYRARQVMIRQGEEHRHALLVLSGSVKVVVNSEYGRDLLMAVRGPGDMLGEMAALEAERRSANVVAWVPTTARVFRGREFADFMERNPEACLALARMLSERLRRVHVRCVDMVVCPAPTRVVKVLVEIALTHGRRTADGWRLGVPLTQPDLASLAGVALSTVEKSLRDLRCQRLLHPGGRHIVITDLDELRRISG
ncbi:Crp/Fnr family transcriptional regulator [Saccharothrix lopnurensis]|uniref:Crp/Fnr family transcriptional regulator n=1 Tax=Saccharothrix lopnurensis TaxID=1670621 RepID=A0ABW1NXP2_9PSEU